MFRIINSIKLMIENFKQNKILITNDKLLYKVNIFSCNLAKVQGY